MVNTDGIVRFDVTFYHYLFLSSRCFPQNSDNFVNISQGWNGDVRSISEKSTLALMSKTPKVVIIGAGAAGVAAASRLLENGMNDLIVLEAENRIGGRIHSVEFAGSIADLGAQWCHGEKDNVVYQLAKDLNVLGSARNNYRDFTFYRSDGKILDKSLTDQIVALVAELSEDEESARKYGTYGDYFTKEYRRRVTEDFFHDQEVVKLAESMLDWFHRGWMCYESGKSWFEVSSTGPFQYKECEGDLYLQFRNKGFRTILDILTKKIPDAKNQLPLEDKILLNKEVNKIIWDSKNATVTCSDGSSYICDHVILTVSLGVLKNMLNSFVPSLPPIKRMAIESMEIGVVHKVLLKFPERWWPEDFKGFSLVWTDEDRKDILKNFSRGPTKDGRFWLEDIYGFFVIDSHPNVLLGWVVGKMIPDIELLPDDLVKDGCMFLLRKFAGKSHNVQEPDGILRSIWKSNPHFNGCYTYRSLEADKRSISCQDLAYPLTNNNNKPVILFAGEATHTKYYSTVHGAIETGFREADRILNMYKSAKLIHRKVAIIGAGMAGLGAATTLLNLGCSDFVLIESQNKPGGRIHTLNLDNGNILELGAQWIHGKDNPLYELAVQHGLLSEVKSEEGLGVYIRDNGEIIDTDIVKRVDFEVGKILRECEEFVDKPDYPTSIGEYLHKRFLDYLTQCRDTDDLKNIKLDLLEWHVLFQVIDNSCQDLNRLSAKGWGNYVCLDDEAHFNLKCGFNELVRILVNNLPKNSLLLSTPVLSIERPSNNLQTNKIICKNIVITCDHLILTPSLGVLKRLKIFPPLPFETSESIQRLGFDAIGKIFLIFDHKWWNEDGFQFVWRRNSEEHSWVKYITGFDPVVHGETVLLGWVGDEGAKVMESMSDEDVGIDCSNLLRRFIRDRIVPNPVKVVKTTWCSNPWVLGGYSHITTDCDRSGLGMHKLSEPVYVDGKPRILIAGEATHSSHYSTIHGAYESGERQAKLLVEYMMKSSKL